MEPEAGATSTHGVDSASTNSILYIAPLRIVAPQGVRDLQEVPPLGVPPDFLQFRRGAHPEMMIQVGPTKSSAVRDYPDGCTPLSKRGAPQDTSQLAQQAAAPESKKPKLFQRDTPKKVGLPSSSEKIANKFEPISKKPLPPFGKLPPPIDTLEEGEIPVVESLPFSQKKRSQVSNIVSKLRVSKRSLIAREITTVGPSHVATRKVLFKTLRLFEAVRRHLLLEEHVRNNRPDLTAGNILSSHGLSLNRNAKRVGPVSGVEVGDIFYFRMELSVAGMHGPIQAGIDYLSAKENRYGAPVAISIISAGGYDAKDEGDELVYTGQGGKSSLDSKPGEDQKLERGNLAMKESMKHQVPVRVIRGVKDVTSPTGKTYIYDGMYKVDKFWSEKGKSGFEEFKFKLQRLPNQPELGSTLIKLSEQLKEKPDIRKGLLISDLSGGQEVGGVCVVNTVDNEGGPAPFKYTTISQFPSGPSPCGQSERCACKNVCNSSKGCACLSRNDNVFAYTSNGLLLKERGAIYECGCNCKCSISCMNKASQKHPKLRFEVFKTEDKGWGLRCQDIIPAGAFVCEYVGQLVDDVSSLQSKDHLLDLSIMPRRAPTWGDVSNLLDKKESARAGTDIPRPVFKIDASNIGNVARFINHSCYPNLLVQCVFRDEQNAGLPHAMLFAMDNIPPFRELTIDYGIVESRLGAPLQGKACACKYVDCRGRFGQ